MYCQTQGRIFSIARRSFNDVGPVVDTKYVEAVHKLCPSVYAYAYDDGMGLAQCPAGTRYDVTFYCPAGRDGKK